MPEPSRSIATRLNESEIASLNQKLSKDGYDSIGDLLNTKYPELWT